MAFRKIGAVEGAKRASSTVINSHQQSPNVTGSHHQSSTVITSYHQSSTVINSHQKPSTIIDMLLTPVFSYAHQPSSCTAASLQACMKRTWYVPTLHLPPKPCLTPCAFPALTNCSNVSSCACRPVLLSRSLLGPGSVTLIGPGSLSRTESCRMGRAGKEQGQEISCKQGCLDILQDML